MTAFRIIPVCCAFGLVLTPASSQAAGTITGVQVSPQSVLVGEQVDITVEGSGTCNLTVQYETSDSGFFANSSMPATVQHAYATTGSKSVTASAPDCLVTGTIEEKVEVKSLPFTTEEKVEVQSPLVQACQILDCSGPFAVLEPKITGVLGLVTPGGALLIGGRKFGQTLGRVYLHGVGGSRLLPVDEWYPDGIGAHFPLDLHDFCVTEVQVETSDGKLTNRWPLPLETGYRWLPTEDVKVLSCGDDGNDNYCNGVESEEDSCLGEYTPLWPLALINSLDQYVPIPSGLPPAISGFHHNCWGAIGDDQDDDLYRIDLKNGWVLDAAVFWSSVPEDEGWTSPSSGSLPSGFQQGATSWQPKITWNVTPGDTVHYALYVQIAGPECAPHK